MGLAFVDEVGDGFYFVVRSVNIGQSVGSLVADGGEAEGANLEKMVEDAVLAERDVLDEAVLDNISRVYKGGRADALDDAAVSDIHAVRAVDGLRNKAGDEDNDVKREDDEAEIMESVVVDIENSVI